MKNYCSHFCMYPSYFLPITIYLSMLFEKTVLAEIVAEKDFYSGADCAVKTNYRHHGRFRPLPDGKDGCFFESAGQWPMPDRQKAHADTSPP